MNARWTAVTHGGTGSRTAPRHLRLAVRGPAPAPAAQRPQLAPEDGEVRPASTPRSPAPARQPKCVSMNGVSQPQGLATMSTGGAAKWVSVPPIETFTNRAPSVAYFSRVPG